MFSQHRRRSTGIAADGQGAFPQSESQPLRKAEGRDIYEDIERIESCRKKSSLVVHPVRKRTRGRSGIFAWQGGGRRRADARQGRQRNHAEIPPGIWFVFWPDVPLELSWTFMQVESMLRFWPGVKSCVSEIRQSQEEVR